MPPRLPALSQVLLSGLELSDKTPARVRMIAPSYRGYWKSTGRATGHNIAADVESVIDWLSKETGASVSPTDQQPFPIANKNSPIPRKRVIIWGQSIGASVGVYAALRMLQSSGSNSSTGNVKVDGLILETPFSSLKEMIIAIYPQKWLPYRYLTPFLKYNWDTVSYIKQLSKLKAAQDLKLLILQAEKDELVPEEQTNTLMEELNKTGFYTRKSLVKGATHVECLFRSDGRSAVSRFISRLIDG